MEFDISFTDKEITPWGGMVFLRKMLDQIGFKKVVEGNSDLPQPGSNRGYKVTTIIESFIVSIWCGANRFMHTEVTRHDHALATIFEWDKVPAQDAFKRFFRKFSQKLNNQVSHYFYDWIFSQIQFDNFILDCDSSVMTRYGEQQGAKKGYNPHKKGRNSHHPMIAFVNDVKLVANMWLRSGNTSSAENFLPFIEDTLAKLKGKKISLIRLDSGFCTKQIMEYLEDNETDYIIAARFYEPIQHLLATHQAWLPLDEGIEISEVMHQASTWKEPRRMVVLRQRIKIRPKATGKTLRLFKDEEFHQRYRYTAYFTNMKLAPPEIWRLYRGRGDSENRIKELKADFGFDSFNLNDFWATEAALTFAMIAYNLMAIFRLFVMKSEIQHTLSTLRYKTFAIGAYFDFENGRAILKLALHQKRRQWFEGLWMKTKVFTTPVRFSNA